MNLRFYYARTPHASAHSHHAARGHGLDRPPRALPRARAVQGLGRRWPEPAVARPGTSARGHSGGRRHVSAQGCRPAGGDVAGSAAAPFAPGGAPAGPRVGVPRPGGEGRGVHRAGALGGLGPRDHVVVGLLPPGRARTVAGAQPRAVHGADGSDFEQRGFGRRGFDGRGGRGARGFVVPLATVAAGQPAAGQ